MLVVVSLKMLGSIASRGSRVPSCVILLLSDMMMVCREQAEVGAILLLDRVSEGVAVAMTASPVVKGVKGGGFWRVVRNGAIGR